MIEHIARNLSLLAGLCLMAGCGITQAKLDERIAETRAYTDQKVGGFDEKVAKTQAASDQKIAAVESALSTKIGGFDEKITTIQAATDQKIAAVESAFHTQETNIRQHQENFRVLLEAESQALDQEKHAVDALLEHIKSPMLSSAQPLPIAHATETQAKTP